MSTSILKISHQFHTMESMSVLPLQTVELDIYKSSPAVFVNDIDSLFDVTEGALRYSASVADRCLLGKIATDIEFKPPVRRNFACSILKQICCKAKYQVSCEKEGDVMGSIEKIAPSYSWAERAVLTLAAFAWSYGELSCQIEIPETNRSGQLISWLKQVDALPGFKQNLQFRKAISDLNALTFSTLDLMKSILQLERLSNPGFDTEHQSSLITNKKNHVEHYSKLAILAAVSCMAQVNCLTFDRVCIIVNIPKLISILNEQLPKLQEFIEKLESEILEWASLSLGSCFRWPSGIVHAFARFTYPQVPELYGPGAEIPVGVAEVLTLQNVLLFISDVTIPTYDYLAMQRIQEELIQRKSDYKIVWVPVAQKWTQDLEEKLKREKQNMPWYILSYKKKEPIVGIEYIKRQWQYCYRPMVVVLNSQGGIECPDAMHMIRIWGFQAFPFSPKPRPVDSCIGPIILELVENKMEEKKYILLFGGTQKSWVKDFSEAVMKMIDDVYFKTTEIAVVPFCYEIVSRKEVIVPKEEAKEQFWNSIASLLYVAVQYNQLDDQVTKDIKKLVSLRYEQGWAALCRGSNILLCASGTIIYKAVDQFNNWKNDLQKPGATFENCLKNYIQERNDQLPCRLVPLQNFNGWLPPEVKCPDCPYCMERMVAYKCCHPNYHPNINGSR